MFNRFNPMMAVWVNRKAAAAIDSVRLIGSKSLNSTTARATSARNTTTSAANPARNSHWESAMLDAVATGSPGAMRAERTPTSAKSPNTTMTTYNTPAIRAVG